MPMVKVGHVFNNTEKRMEKIDILSFWKSEVLWNINVWDEIFLNLLIQKVVRVSLDEM